VFCAALSALGGLASAPPLRRRAEVGVPRPGIAVEAVGRGTPCVNTHHETAPQTARLA
jgi:hypothetical protein